MPEWRLAVLLFALLLSGESWAQGREYRIVDVQSVRAEGTPAQWVHIVQVPTEVPEIACDILVAGGGMGGVAAALRAAQRGHSVCLTEPSDWLGGQMTAGGVSALDENRYIEITGGTRSYHELRRRIRDHYRTAFSLAPAVASLEDLNPGACYVSALCFEPKAGVRTIAEMLAPYRSRITTFLRTEIFNLEIIDGVIRSALAYRLDRDQVIRVRPKFVLDATETGDLLPLAHVPYVVGSEAKSETGEPHAGDTRNIACVQSFTYPFAIDHRPGEMHRIAKPLEYEKFRDGQPFSLRLYYPVELGWKGYVSYSMFGDDPPIPNNQTPRSFFSWRRLIAGKNFIGPNAPSDLALINWPGQDYHTESLLDRSPLEFARVLQQAKRLSLAFLYWLQTEVPRDDGKGFGYPELRLRADVMDSADGLSKCPYIRESRRIRAKTIVVEQDIVAEYQSGARAKWFPDSVGTGFYMVDIHPCGLRERGRMMMPRPFQIPMGALIPEGVHNLLVASKDIGVTHLTNGAFRLHPVEWNVGEASAVIASLAIAKGALPDAFAVQKELVNVGVPLVWFDDVPVDHPAFAAIHLAAIRGVYPLNDSDLHAAPDAPVSRSEAAQALAAFFGYPSEKYSRPPAEAAVALALERGWMATDHRNWFHGDQPFYWSDWREEKLPQPLPAFTPKRRGPVTRAELATRLAWAWQ